MGELLLRMVFSLAVVVGLLILISRVAARRLHGRAGSPIEVLHRQALSKSASVSVVSVAGRVLVLGSTDQQVNVLTELDADAFGTPETVEARDTDQHTTDDDLDDPLATELTDDELATLLAGDEPMTVLGDAAAVHAVDATGLVVTAGRTVAVVGLEDVVVVDTPDALLVTSRARAQEVKAVVAALKESGRTDLV